MKNIQTYLEKKILENIIEPSVTFSIEIFIYTSTEKKSHELLGGKRNTWLYMQAQRRNLK